MDHSEDDSLPPEMAKILQSMNQEFSMARSWDESDIEQKREICVMVFRGIKLIGRVLANEIDETQFVGLMDELINDSIKIDQKYKL
jgi:hypothetical protein